MALLRVDGLRKAFGGVVAVDDVSFRVSRGELVALIGPNGAGKTTCFNMLNGQLRPDRGRVVLDGEDVTGLSPRRIWRKGVGRTFQITATFPSMTVVENVQMPMMSRERETYRLWPRATRLHRREAMELLELVGMADQAQRPCGVLAYGDLKRVELAVALANEPALLLMDEPTAGMAPGERVALMGLTAEIVKSRNIAVLFTEHDMDVVFCHADRILVLNRGRLVAEGPPDAIRENDHVKEIYLGVGDGLRDLGRICHPGGA
ncbi:MAG: ABC transporter ATP-binding protein [Candidatus Dadabacteria bacterium]|nr:MAG: ABC transporter ATP-binding protein [Candidatus Dadabacteria bacterium]